VELVEDDGGEGRQQRVLLKSGGEDAFGRDEQARIRTESPLEADLPSDFPTDVPLAFGGNSRSNGTRRHAPGLQQDYWAIFDERRRDACGLASARLCREDRGTHPTQCVNDLRNVRINWKWGHGNLRSTIDDLVICLKKSIVDHQIVDRRLRVSLTSIGDITYSR
jgi:hypothetical protein